MKILGREICSAEIKPIKEAKQEVIWIPPWYDILHFIPEEKLPEDERIRRQRDRIKRMSQSPSPQLAKNIGTIMTSLDDLQDFLTTLGVFSRIGGRILKPLNVIARGSFTVGETLNQMNVMQKAMRAAPKVGRTLREKLRKLNDLPKGERRAAKFKEMRKAGIDPSTPMHSLKAMKRRIEETFQPHPKLSTIQTAVEKRMKRGLPRLGEICEMAQTSDMIASVGISLGPVVGMIQDLIFGLPKGVPVRFANQKISSYEMQALFNLAAKVRDMPPPQVQLFNESIKMLESFAHNLIAGKYIPIQDTITSLAGTSNAYLNVRCSQLKEAIRSSIEIIKGWFVGPKPHTKGMTLAEIASLGIDPYAHNEWPVDGLGAYNTPDEVFAAFFPKVLETITWARQQTNGTVEIEFIDQCVYDIAQSTASFLTEDTDSIKIEQALELTLLTRAIDEDIMPPDDCTDEEYLSWTEQLILQTEYYGLDAPDYDLYEDAWFDIFT